MEKEFWLERWEREEIGFHEGEVNEYLAEYWRELKFEKDCDVFVPLCGKSADLNWLREQGHRVIGVELSQRAVHAFFKEKGYVATQSSLGKFDCYEANDIQILCGDFFELSREQLMTVKVVYDRASMIALPLEMRKSYVQHLITILPAHVQILLVAIDYSQDEMSGPPFALSSEEVELLYGKYASIKRLAQKDVLDKNPRFKRRGLTCMHESLYLLTLLEGGRK